MISHQHQSYRRTVSASLFAATLPVFLLAIFSFRLQEEKAAMNELTLIRQKIEMTDELLTQLLNVETGQRGYETTGEPVFLEPHREGKQKVPEALNRLEQVEPNLKILREHVSQVLLLSDLVIQRGATQAKMEAGKKAMDAVRVELDDIRSQNSQQRDRILQERQDREQRDILLAIGSVVITLLLWWLQYKGATNMRSAVDQAEKSRELEEQLRYKAEEALELQEKLTAAEELARTEAERILEKEKELSEAKSLIIQTISHEYRTPLTTILTAVELLAVIDPASQKRQRYIDQIKGGVRRLVGMTEDVLVLFKFDAGAVTPESRVIYLQPWFESLIESFDGYERVILDIKTPQISTDEGLLYKIFINLIGNALKYSAKSVLVAVESESAYTRFSIKDSGIGIPDSMRLYQAFERGSNVGKVVGTGLGLSIVKKAVDLLGGSINVESEERRGTEIVVVLPN